MRIRSVLTAATILIGVSACGTTEPGTPIASSGQPETSSSTAKPTKSPAPTSTLPSHGAPKVTSPLKADKFQADPCSVFTQEQLREYGVGPGTADTDEGGKVCSWETNDEGGIDLGWDDLIGTGLSRVYKGHKNGKYAFFDVLPDIEGLPAVSYDQKDQRKQGICTVSVGVSDQLSFMVSIAQSASKQGTRPPCEVAATVAADAVRSMKAGG